MNQPELGKLISEIRNQKGITQKQLSESCNIDIRTVQRIECGEVVPRHSTLKLIAEFLEYDFHQVDLQPVSQISVSKDLILIAFIAGIVNIVNWLFHVAIIPLQIDGVNLQLITSMVHFITSVFFYIGFFILGRKYKSVLLQITSVAIIILVPIMTITDILGIYTNLDFMVYVMKLLGIIIGINGILLGVAMLLIQSKFSVLWKVGGIFQIIVNPLFIIPLTVLYQIGFYITIPSLILFAIILIVEYKNTETILPDYKSPIFSPDAEIQ